MILILAERLEGSTTEEEVEIHRQKSAGSDVLQTLAPDWLHQAACRHATVVLPTTPPVGSNNTSSRQIYDISTQPWHICCFANTSEGNKTSGGKKVNSSLMIFKVCAVCSHSAGFVFAGVGGLEGKPLSILQVNSLKEKHNNVLT